ncbi:MAG: DNA-directed RNA polymerase subunit beta [Anaerolineales bacterium]|nr:MAG: DNA-directed RNA polymerase subunit beta [Anaerolineales bacterium]
MSHTLARKSYARIPDVLELPKLIEVQLKSFEWFLEEGLAELFAEVSPIVSFNKNLELHFLDYRFDEPKYPEDECRERDMTYASPLWVNVQLVNKDTGEIMKQEVFMGDFPLMTTNGTFVINGAERVVVSQLIRSPGVYFTAEEDRVTGRALCFAKLIPNRGAWLEFETSKRDIISVKVDRKRKLPVTILLRAVGYGTDEELFELFSDADIMPDHSYIATTLDRDPTKTVEEALLEFYKKLRPGDPPTLDNANNFLTSLLFSSRRYDLGKVGRYKLNRRLGLDVPIGQRTLTKEDLVKVVTRMILVNNGVDEPDDIDHLGNRRVKTVGELIQNQLRVGLLRMERVVRERMSIRDPEQVTPMSLVNIRPVVAATREFFGGSQLSQFMDQTNPLAELTHKRTLSALGPGGLRRERAGFDVRDVHHSHYGRICPIETPEGPNIGLIGRLATFGHVNEYGFIETPYRKVVNQISHQDVDALLGRTLRAPVVDPTTGDELAGIAAEIDEDLAIRISQLPLEETVKIKPFVTDQIIYMPADEEDRFTIAQANAELDEKWQFVGSRVSVRRHQTFLLENVERVDFMDVSPKQIVGISAALIPFLEHDDANRALMGSNMQRQAVPLIRPEAPLVGTGMEYQAAIDSGQVVAADKAYEVISVTSDSIVVREDNGKERRYPLRKFNRSNQSTCIDQRPVVWKGDRVQKGDVLVDSSSTDHGELALGQNVLCAFLSWEGGNYEDAILISEDLVRRDKFTSIHVEKHEIEARDTKLGPEEITRDIPNVGEEALKDLDEGGIVRVGAEVGPGDVLVGKITPKGETELTPEEKLLRAIFGEKAREVKDSSLRLPHGEKGIVVDVKEFSRDEHRDLPAGVDQMVRVMVAQRRKITEGDKVAGRHGNKGVISRVVPVEDMPFLEDGTPIEIILNPLGVPARMNIGQILETHLGWAASQLGFRAITSVFDGAHEDEIAAELARAWLIEHAWKIIAGRAWAWATEQGYTEQELESEDEARTLFLVEWLGELGYDEERLALDRGYARRIVLREWLVERGYDPDFLLAFEGDRRPEAIGARAREAVRIACLREWLHMLRGRSERYADRRYWGLVEGVDLDALDDGEVDQLAIQVTRKSGIPLPTAGKMILYDGKTGEPFDRPVTVGVISMLKLAHLVEDKVHARSTGPYSLVTQQPLGGKAQFGGQRFGEMEVWALEAYGAAHTLQEMLTVKSDDVTGRVKTYEAIVKGEPIQEPGVPESFRVLVKELQSLGLSVEVVSDSEDRVQFGKEEQKEKLPRLGLGLGFKVPGSRF